MMKSALMGERTFQEAIIRLVTDDLQFGERMTEATAFENFGHEIWLITQHICIFLKNRGTGPNFN
jgi:hypothetical protein